MPGGAKEISIEGPGRTRNASGPSLRHTKLRAFSNGSMTLHEKSLKKGAAAHINWDYILLRIHGLMATLLCLPKLFKRLACSASSRSSC